MSAPKGATVAGTVDIKGVQILHPGTFNGVPLSRRDLDEMVTAFDATSDALPVGVRLGHDARQAFAKAMFGDGQAAADAAEDAQGWPVTGWVDRLYMSGDTLTADLTGVPVKLAEWIKGKLYRTRSGGLRYNRTVGGQVYRWMLDHLAILGADTPAVDGLADIGLSTLAPGGMVTLSYQATDTDGLLTLGESPGQVTAEEETTLSRFVAAMRAMFDEHAPLLFKRTGSPRARTLFAAFLDDVGRVARADFETLSSKGATMNLTDIRAALNLAADADNAATVAALAGADETQAGALVDLAAPMAFESADQLVGWLSGALGVGPGDLGGLAGKILELMGGAAPEVPADGAPPEAGAAAPGGMGMSASGNVDLSAQVVDLSAQVVSALTRVAELESANARAAAEAKVDADAKARGITLPVPVRTALVNLAAAGDTATYAAILPNVVGVPVTERGTSAGGGEGASLAQPADTDLAMMVKMGYAPETARDLLLASARQDAGLPPAQKGEK